MCSKRYFKTTQDNLAAIIGAQKDTPSEFELRIIWMEALGSLEGLGDEISRFPRLQKVTLNELLSDDSLISIMPFSQDRQRKIAGLMMRWASPETLETCQYLPGLEFELVVSLKPKGRRCAGSLMVTHGHE